MRFLKRVSRVLLNKPKNIQCNPEESDTEGCFETQSDDSGRRKVRFSPLNPCRKVENLRRLSPAKRADIWYTSEELATMRIQAYLSVVDNRVNRKDLDKAWRAAVSLTAATMEESKVQELDEALRDETASSLEGWVKQDTRGLETIVSETHLGDRVGCATAARALVVETFTLSDFSGETEHELVETLGQQYSQLSRTSVLFACMIGHADAEAAGVKVYCKPTPCLQSESAQLHQPQNLCVVSS